MRIRTTGLLCLLLAAGTVAMAATETVTLSAPEGQTVAPGGTIAVEVSALSGIPAGAALYVAVDVGGGNLLFFPSGTPVPAPYAINPPVLPASVLSLTYTDGAIPAGTYTFYAAVISGDLTVFHSNLASLPITLTSGGSGDDDDDDDDTISVTSTSFTDGGTLADTYARLGGNTSPQLSWTGKPAGTQSYAVLCYDPDAPGGDFTHWILFNVPAATTSLAEGMPKGATLDGGMEQGVNDFGDTGYDGPQPPVGDGPHRYVFLIYALDTTLPSDAGQSRMDFDTALSGHVLGTASITGKYER